MKLEPIHPDDLLRRFVGVGVPADEPACSEERKRRVVGRISDVMRSEVKRKASRRRMQRVATAVLLAAAVVLLVAGWKMLEGGSRSAAAAYDHVDALAGTVLVMRHGQAVAAGASPTTLLEADEVRTSSDGQARVTLSQGQQILVSPDSRVGMLPVSAFVSAIDLPIGRVDVQIPKLVDGKTFSVRTPHAEVVVHGTRFVVEVGAFRADGIAPTAVRVLEGRVAVRVAGREVMIEAGSFWTNEVQAAVVEGVGATTVVAVTPPADLVAVPPQIAPSSVAVRATAVAVASDAGVAAQPSSTLSEENRLYRAAMDARRRGDDGEAIRQLDALLSRFPNSTLAQEARVERFRCLRRLGKEAAAAGEARRYLAEHPDGFARDEARGLVLPAAPSASH
jgi:hypothetical protein